MTRVELLPEVGDDLDRICDHLSTHETADAAARIQEIIQALDVLVLNPLIGRPVAAGKRELVIGRESRGYIALYRYIEAVDTIFVLALRSQREAGYARD